MKRVWLLNPGLWALTAVLLGARNGQSRQPVGTDATAVPAQPAQGVPGTPSGPRPSDDALNAPEQNEPAHPSPTKAAAMADSVNTAPASGSTPFVGRATLPAVPGKNRPSPANTRSH